MTSFVQRLFSCGSKDRSSSARHGNMKKTVPAPNVCESCQEQFNTRASLNSHSKNCKKVASFAEQNKSMDRSRDTKPHGTSESILTPVNVQIQSNASTKKDLAEKNEQHDRSTLDPNRTITNDKSFTSVSTDKPYRRTDTFSDKPGSALMSPIDNEVNKITTELLKKAPKARRDAELNFITKNIEKKTHTRYLISEQWIEDYTAYLNGEHSQSPQPINNDKLKEMVISKTLPNNIYLVNEIIWKFVHKLYGGGPEIKQFNKSISFAGANTSTDHLSETQTADTFSRSDGTESLRNSILDTYTAPWYTNTTPYLKPMGFHNTSFYCYMNASLQMLLSITDFSQYIYQEKYKTLSGKEETKFWKAMTEVVHSHFKQQSCVLPRALRKLSAKNFDPDQQHDAHEFLSFLLSGLQDEVNLPCPKKENEFKNPDSAWSYYRKSNISLVDDLLAGQLVSTVRCTSCKHVSTTYDPFLDLSLPIIPGKTKNLDDCLQAYQQEEDIDDSYKCEKCKATGKAKKRLHIHRCPRYLLLNLKRFETYPKKRKIKDMITYPATNFRIKDESEGQLAGYTLVGIVVHYGPIDSGHYTCFTKRGDDWIHCDDDNLSKVDENEVLSKEAYVFLYERKPTIGVAKL